MKRITLLLLIVTSLSFSQKNDYYNDSGAYHFKSITDVEGKSKKEIYDAAKKWIAVNFNDLNRVLKLDSEDNMLIKGNSELKDTGGTRVDFTLDLAFKDGKLKTEFYDVTIRPKVFIPEYTLAKPVSFTKQDYINLMKKEFDKSGLTEKQSKKAIDQMGIDELFSDMIKSMEFYASSVESRVNELSTSLGTYVNNSEDGW